MNDEMGLSGASQGVREKSRVAKKKPNSFLEDPTCGTEKKRQDGFSSPRACSK